MAPQAVYPASGEHCGAPQAAGSGPHAIEPLRHVSIIQNLP